MRFTCWCLICLVPLLCSGQCFRDVVEQRNAEAARLYEQKQYAAAAAILEQLRKNLALAELEDTRGEILYNLACDYSLMGDAQKALDVLREAAAAGGLSTANLRHDSDFDNIRKNPGFVKLLEDLDAKDKPARMLWNSPSMQIPYRDDLPEDQKIAGLSLIWSEAKYNFAYFHRLNGIDWDGLYLSYLSKVRKTKDTLEYYQTLAEFIAHLRDGHTNVNFPQQARSRLGWPGIDTRLVEGRVFIDEVPNPELASQGIVRGFEIVAVDGTPVKQYGEQRVAPRISASSPQDLAMRVYEGSLLSGPLETPVELTLRDAAGNDKQVTVPRKSSAESAKFPRKPWKRFEHRTLDGNIAYVALRTFGDNAIVKDFDQAFDSMRSSDALILDVRENGGGSSGNGWSILGYLTDKEYLSSQWRTRDYRPSFRAWGNPEKWYSRPGRALPPHGPNPYRKPVVVLIGTHTYSAAEDFAVSFDVMKRGKLIGSPTGGSTGQPLVFALPGGGSARICTKHDRYPDGKEFVGVGVQPDIAVAETIEDFRAGRDTVLEAALRYLRQPRP